MNNVNIFSSLKDSTCGRGVEDANGFNTNDNSNKLNGDVNMKRDIKVLSKKQFKALSKGHAYKEYEAVGELANNLKVKADEALEFFKAAKQDTLRAESMLLDASYELDDVQAKLAKSETELAEMGNDLAEMGNDLAKYKTELAEMGNDLAKKETELAKKDTELAENKAQLENTQTQLEETEIKLAEANGKIDAGFDLTTEIQNDLEDLIEDRDENMETYNRLDARMAGKKARANINMGTIRHYNNIIRQCKKDIEKGKDVEGNKAIIFELQSEIRNLQRQVEAANGTFNDMKHNKTVVSQKIVKMDDELNKRYKLNNLLGELGYI